MMHVKHSSRIVHIMRVMSDVSEKENEPVPLMKEASHHRRRLTAPMHKILGRLSAFGENKKSEMPVKSRLSFQHWRRQKFARKGSKTDDSVKEDAHGSANEPVVRLALVPNASPGQPGRLKRREPLKAAPLAESEDIDLSEPKKPKLITAARRFTAFTTTRPIVVRRTFHKMRVTEYL